MQGTERIIFDFKNFNINNFIVEQAETIYIDLAEVDNNRFYKLIPEAGDDLISVYEKYKLTNYNPKMIFDDTDVMKKYTGIIGFDLGILKQLNKESDSFVQWVRWVNDGGVLIIPKKQPYIQILTYFILNRLIFNDNPEYGLVVLSSLWNYYFKSIPGNKAARLYYEWCFEYWELYCKESICYEKYSKLFVVNIIVNNPVKKEISLDYYTIDITKLKTH
ncbi:hypothetical protein [Pseudobutyrivibrio ruminis]|uniref:hypothetical protein n=1 Tax=Pseudobutyrivibrio ruminis TaxID=46206 RepID=UPI000412BF3B|nr:hypothetical protein [Pseudobutyrivibrio ruminis]